MKSIGSIEEFIAVYDNKADYYDKNEGLVIRVTDPRENPDEPGIIYLGVYDLTTGNYAGYITVDEKDYFIKEKVFA